MAACVLSLPLAPLQAGGAMDPAPGAGREASRRQAGEGPSAVFSHLNASVVLDEAGHWMEVRLRISMVTGRNTSSVVFALNGAMDISSVAEEGNGALFYHWMLFSWVNVSLGRTVPAQTALNITVAYGGGVHNTPDGGSTYWDYIGTEGSWVRTYNNYFPHDEQSTRTTYRLSVTLPQGKMVAAAGALAGNWTDPANGTATFVWDMARAVRGISFSAARVNLTSVTVGQRTYNLFFREDHGSSAQGYASELDRACGFYTSLVGAPGMGNLTVVEVPDTYAAWGQTVPSMIWVASRNFAGPFPYRLLAHEMAHQWWGVDVEGEQLFDNWLQEGFAGYCEALYEMATYHSRGYLDFCRTQYINTFVQSGSPEPPLVSNDYDLSAYKGPWVLHMLKYLAGETKFYRALGDFHANFSGRLAVPQDFVSSAAASTGLALEGFFDFWLNTSGRLDYAISEPVIYKGPGGRDRLCVTVENRGRAAGLPADMGLYDAAGQRMAFLDRAWNGTGPESTVARDIDYSVDSVKLDPDEWLLDVYPSNNEAPTRDARLDFRMDGLSISPQEPEGNRSFTLNLGISSNSSEGPNTVEYGVFVDGLPAGNSSADLPAAGRVFSYYELALPAGAHVLKAVLDPQSSYYEADGANNQAWLNVTVRAWQPPRPDMRVLAGNIALAPASAVAGEAANLTALVENIGPADAGRISVEFWVDSGGEAMRTSLPALPAKASSLATVPWTALPGWHEISARVSLESGEDADVSNDAAAGLVYVNIRPYAILSAQPRDATPGDWVEFSGASSTDDGGVAYYLFDFGDGETTGWLVDGSSWHSYSLKGAYQARLRVQDRTGAESDWSEPVTVRVNDAPPSATVSIVPRAGYAGTVFYFTCIARDIDGNVTACEWAFGDGMGAQGETVNHTYATHGDFRVTLKVTDDASQTCETSVTLTVLDSPPMPAISLNRSRALVGEYIGFSARGSSDPDDPASALSFRWDFGDGQMAWGQNASYAFRRPGDYMVILTASDGNLSADLSVTVTVPQPARQAAPGGPGWQSWAVLAALLLAMALVTISMMIPERPKEPRDDEEE